jgi:hypothetical protein
MLRVNMSLRRPLLIPDDRTGTQYFGAILDSCLTAQFTLDGRTCYSIELAPITSLGFIPTS